MKKSRLSVPFAVALGVVGVALFPELLTIALMQQDSEKRRVRVSARHTVCAGCGSLLTEEALMQAASLWAAHIAQMQREPSLCPVQSCASL